MRVVSSDTEQECVGLGQEVPFGERGVVVTRAVTRLGATVKPEDKGGTVTAIAIDRPSTRRDAPDPLAELRVAHDEAAAIAAELDLDDARLWREVEGIVIEITSAAYAVTSRVTGAPAEVTASLVPPIVRVRELATAQRRLFAAMDRRTLRDQLLAEMESQRVRGLGLLLRCVALSEEMIGVDRGGG